MKTAAALTLVFLAVAGVFAILWPICQSLVNSETAIVRVAGALLGSIGILAAIAGVCGLLAHLLDSSHSSHPSDSTD